MSEMAFLPQLKTFLKSNGYIYTVRKFKYCSPGGFTTVQDVGACKRTYIGTVYNQADLETYVAYSGFIDASKWWKMIRTFIKPGVAMYLYKVAIIK